MAALIALVTPLPYSADWRSYFTIHDPAFAALAAGELPGNSNALPRLLGVTNLYFVKARTAVVRSVSPVRSPALQLHKGLPYHKQPGRCVCSAASRDCLPASHCVLT